MTERPRKHNERTTAGNVLSMLVTLLPLMGTPQSVSAEELKGGQCIEVCSKEGARVGQTCFVPKKLEVGEQGAAVPEWDMYVNERVIQWLGGQTNIPPPLPMPSLEKRPDLYCKVVLTESQISDVREAFGIVLPANSPDSPEGLPPLLILPEGGTVTPGGLQGLGWDTK